MIDQNDAKKRLILAEKLLVAVIYVLFLIAAAFGAVGRRWPQMALLIATVTIFTWALCAGFATLRYHGIIRW